MEEDLIMTEADLVKPKVEPSTDQPLQDVKPHSWPSNDLEALGLVSVHVEDWIILMRDHFDVFIEQEPYSGIQMLVHLESKTYIQRVWGRTRISGQWSTDADLVMLCQGFFQNIKPCLGSYADPMVFETLESLGGETVKHPVHRVASFTCLEVYEHHGQIRDKGVSMGACGPCKELMVDLKSEHSVPAYDEEEANVEQLEVGHLEEKEPKESDSEVDKKDDLNILPDNQLKRKVKKKTVVNKSEEDLFELADNPKGKKKEVKLINPQSAKIVKCDTVEYERFEKNGRMVHHYF